MGMYATMYRLGYTPWERYGSAAAGSIAARLDREESERSRPPGRALDLGCGRGQYTPELTRRGWEVVGVDNVPQAIAAARRKDIPGATVLMMEFSRPTPLRSFAGGVSADEVGAALPGWEMLGVEDAETAGLDWPMSRMQPQWFRLRRR